MATRKNTRAAQSANPASSSQPSWNFTPRRPQEPLLKLLMGTTPNVLAAGSSRVGKSFLLMIWLLLLSEWYPGSRHGVFRRNRNAAEANLFKITLYQAMNVLNLTGYLASGINKADLSVTFPNGSVISFNGLDEHNRDRILGSEYQTIWMNEVSEFQYDDVEFLRGRLYGDIKKSELAPPNAPAILPKRMFFDENPDTFDDWSYKVFVQNINPLNNKPLQHPEDYAYVRMVTDDQEYIRRNIDQTDEWKQRFIYANWTASNPDALFQRKMINDYRYYGDLNELRLKRVVVGVDPAVTSNDKSDLTGIVVVGLGFDNEAYVLADYSVKSKDWEIQVVKAFDDFQADLIVAERNNGGDMVEKMIYQARRNAPVKTVWASRGKEARAEPIAQQYRKGRVHHVSSEHDLSELETQMCSFGSTATKGKSPDRLDALCWAIWELLNISNTTGPTRIKQVPQAGYWR